MPSHTVARVAAASLALSVAGAAIGAAVSVIALGVCWALIFGPPFIVDALALAGIVGACLGGISGPLIAWIALRDVPLWIAFTQPAVGALIGGLMGAITSGLDPVVAVGCAAVGMLVAAVRLRMRTRPVPRGLPPRR